MPERGVARGVQPCNMAGLATRETPRFMKQIEVRLAVVLYGGVSLAVYIHGVTREILNLVRASKLFHAGPTASPPAGDSTVIYYELFRRLAPALDIRVVVDLISGASAGGINGVMLGKALAHDLPLEPHRDLWLKNADVTSLSARGGLVGRGIKAAMAPLFDHFLIRQFGKQVADPETRGKLRQFIQAQWFTPPFSGERFAGWMLVNTGFLPIAPFDPFPFGLLTMIVYTRPSRSVNSGVRSSGSSRRLAISSWPRKPASRSRPT